MHRLLIGTHWICLLRYCHCHSYFIREESCPGISWISKELYSPVCLSHLSPPLFHCSSWFLPRLVFFCCSSNTPSVFPSKGIHICYTLFLDCSMPRSSKFVFFFFIESYSKHSHLSEVFSDHPVTSSSPPLSSTHHSTSIASAWLLP